MYRWDGWRNCARIEIELKKTHFEIVKDSYHGVLSVSIYKPPYQSINHILLQL